MKSILDIYTLKMFYDYHQTMNVQHEFVDILKLVYIQQVNPWL